MLRSAVESDLRVIAAWVRTSDECWFWAGGTVRFPIDVDALATILRLSSDTSFVLDDLTAFGQIFDKGNGLGHLAHIIVAPGERGRGRGYALMNALLDVASARGLQRVGLNVQSGNSVAIALYRKLGFRAASRPAGLGASVGAEYMCRELQVV